MSETLTCSGSSIAAGESLAATATQGTNWLLVEVRGAWGRDAVADSGLPPGAREAMDAFPGKVILVRRPDRRRGVTVIKAIAEEAGGTAAWQELGTLEELPGADLEKGELVSGPIVLVCGHGRRDACCARLGLPLFDEMTKHVPPARLWQASHLGGHRFAPNVLVLPYGIQLGRISLERAPEVAELLAGQRVPLDLYRGRTMYAPAVQAAELAVRSATGCDGLADLQLVAHAGHLVTFATPAGELAVRVEERSGPVLAMSCGADPEATTRWVTSSL